MQIIKKIQKVGTSKGIVFDAYFIKALKLEVGDELIIDFEKRKK